MPKLFCTGVTGYIGGDGLYVIANAHPEYEITALVRNSDKGAKVAKQFPNVKLVYGDLDSADVISDESAKADIVLHWANCDHEPSASAIISGLSRRSSPGYLIHTSGTGILEVDDLQRGAYGAASEKVYDDWDGVAAVTSLPDEAWHRNVDKIVLGAPANVRTAIVCPPTIFGPGRGPDNQRGDQVPKMIEAVLKRKRGFKVGDGLNRWTQVHVQDLSDVYLRLVEEAVRELNGEKSSATWDDQGYYFAENGEYVWGEMAAAVAKAVQQAGLIDSAELESVTPKVADEILPAGSAKWGMNSRGKAVRARKLLGWHPKQPRCEGLLPQIVESEATRLGLKVGHAVKAAGDA